MGGRDGGLGVDRVCYGVCVGGRGLEVVRVGSRGGGSRGGVQVTFKPRLWLLYCGSCCLT